MAKPQKGSHAVSVEVYRAETHLLLGSAGASHLAFIKQTEKAIAAAVRAVKATLLRVHPHHFFPNKEIADRATVFEFLTNSALLRRYCKIILPYTTINLERER